MDVQLVTRADIPTALQIFVRGRVVELEELLYFYGRVHTARIR